MNVRFACRFLRKVKRCGRCRGASTRFMLRVQICGFTLTPIARFAGLRWVPGVSGIPCIGSRQILEEVCWIQASQFNGFFFFVPKNTCPFLIWKGNFEHGCWCVWGPVSEDDKNKEERMGWKKVALLVCGTVVS